MADVTINPAVLTATVAQPAPTFLTEVTLTPAVQVISVVQPAPTVSITNGIWSNTAKNTAPTWSNTAKT